MTLEKAFLSEGLRLDFIQGSLVSKSQERWYDWYLVNCELCYYFEISLPSIVDRSIVNLSSKSSTLLLVCLRVGERDLFRAVRKYKISLQSIL